MSEQFTELVRRLTAAHGDELVSVILHGSAVVTGKAARASDYRLIVVTRTLPAGVLRQAQPVAQWWTAGGFHLPVYFTQAEFMDSLDVFPIEFRQMKRAYRILHGADLLADVTISLVNLRWQIEHELRGKVLRLRGLYLPASETAEGLTRLMTDSVVSFVQLLRPTLELLGDEPPLDRQDVIRRAGERLNMDLQPLERVLRLRNEPVALLDAEAQDLFAEYLNCVSRIVSAIDRLRPAA
ncbi:MAG: hypothetical protein ACKV2V_04230 [Blastocatellia bacterium]